jgi:hypothetical protein
MTDKQPKALWLAELLDGDTPMHCEQAATELRRLHEVNAELVEALRYCRQKIAYMTTHGEWYSPGSAIEKADAALAKATGEQQ